jgi:RHS repeat-associated protein
VYVGGSYEVELNAGGGATTYTSYYNALTARVMRVDGGPAAVVYYILTDQLGSASMMLNANGALVGTARYYAFGETRLATGSMVTDKLYTGQRQDSIGLYDFHARFYDPYLNRFISADTIVPAPGNPQTLNRYSYSLNSPLNHTDPSGHKACDFDNKGKCIVDQEWRQNKTPPPSAEDYGATFLSDVNSSWDPAHEQEATEAVRAVARAIANITGGTPVEAFKKVYGKVTFYWGTTGNSDISPLCQKIAQGGCTSSRHLINFVSMSTPGENRTADMAYMSATNNAVHELGHAFAYRWPASIPDPNGLAGSTINNPDNPVNQVPLALLTDLAGWPESPESAHLTWRQHPCSMDDGTCYAGEVFADMFLGWTYSTYGSDETGTARKEFMTTNMAEWLNP